MSTTRTLLLGSVAVVLAGALAYDWTRDDDSALQAVRPSAQNAPAPAVAKAVVAAQDTPASGTGPESGPALSGPPQASAPAPAQQPNGFIPQAAASPGPAPNPPSGGPPGIDATPTPSGSQNYSAGPPGAFTNSEPAAQRPALPQPNMAAATDVPLAPPGWKPDVPATGSPSASGAGPGNIGIPPQGPNAHTSPLPAGPPMPAPPAPAGQPQLGQPQLPLPTGPGGISTPEPVFGAANAGTPSGLANGGLPHAGQPAPSQPNLSQPNLSQPNLSHAPSAPTVAPAPAAQPSVAPQRPRPPQQSLAGIHPLAGLFASELSVTRERPLFETSRRPMTIPRVVAPEAKPVPVQAPAALPETSGLRLVGVVTSDDKRTALLTPGGGGKTFRVDAGDTVEGWTVQTIKLDSVVLERQSKRDTVRMQRDATQKK